MAGLVDMVDQRIKEINNDLFNLNARKTELEAELVKLQTDKEDYNILVSAKVELDSIKTTTPIEPII